MPRITLPLSLGEIGVVWSLLLALPASWILYELLKALYSISPLHPLYKIPGPKLAAATYLPEFYHDVWLHGRYTHAIRKMHEEYGPIVRINPNETHCNDVTFADEIYAVGGRKRNKPLHQVNLSASNKSNSFGTRDHDLHRTRRAAVSKFFSHAMIEKLEGEVQFLAQKLCNKMLAHSGTAPTTPLGLMDAYSCFTTDVISQYGFGESFGLLDQAGWTPNFHEAALSLMRPMFWFRFFPFLVPVVRGLTRFVRYLPPGAAMLVRTLHITIPGLVDKSKADLSAGIRYERPTVLGSLLESDLSEPEKSRERLADEAASLVGAGTETTSWALVVVTFHLLENPAVLEKLGAELSTVVGDPMQLPSWRTLEVLPYLGAVITEGLRLSAGMGRTAREPIGEDLVYKGDWRKKEVQVVLPRGYAVGMSSILTHHDEKMFRESDRFMPERWLDGDGQRDRTLDRGCLAFSRGSRACLGRNLALCEIHLALVAVVLRVMPKMKLYQTTMEDVAYDHDMLAPAVKAVSKGVRVVIE